MSQLETDLSVHPYYDDYDPLKRFYRILFVPSRAVQTRELNQIQTIIQEQIRRFGDHIFKDGSIVNGCNVQYVPSLKYVRLDNGWNVANNNIAFDSSLENYLVVSPSTGTRASIRKVRQGYQNLYPHTNVFYVDYIKNGRDGANNEVKQFVSGETLEVYNTEQNKLGTLDSGKLFNTIETYTANVSANQISTGSTYAVTVGEGIVYQKGFFLNCLTHTVLVRDFSTEVDEYFVGFNTAEAIATHLQDASLKDPVNNGNNDAPGADRLILVPELVSRKRDEIVPEDGFFPIVEFSGNKPVIQNTDPEYAKLGTVLAGTLVDHAGDFHTKMFTVDTEANANTAFMNYVVSTGIGYVKGNRVEFLTSRRQPTTRATTVEDSQNAIVTMNYGYYAIVNQMAGIFDGDNLVSANLYDEAMNTVSDNESIGSAPTGAVIGTANIRAAMYEDGTKGTAGCTWRLYLTNIQMSSGKSFNSDVLSIAIPGVAKADFVQENGKTILKDSSKAGLVFPIGVEGLRSLKSLTDVNDTTFYTRDKVTATLQSNGFMTFTLNSPHAGGFERFFSSVGSLSNANELKVDVALSSAAYTADLAGTVDATTTTANNVLTGTSTTFLTDFKAGDKIRIAANSTVSYERVIEQVTDNTSMQLNVAVAHVASTATYQKYFSAGSILDLSSGVDVNVLSNTQFTVDMHKNIQFGAPQTVTASYPVMRSQAVAGQKTVRKEAYVKIDCSTGGIVGPWNLGLCDVFSLDAVYVGSSYAVTNPDRKTWFSFNNGQTATHYDHAKLLLKPSYKTQITSATKILVKVSYFVHDFSAGIGFFSVDSYPARLPGVAANSSNISFADIPQFAGMSLRDSIDFRPRKYDTAAYANTVGAATVNPAVSNTSFDIEGSGAYLPEPDSNFIADITYFLPRRDLIQIGKDGSVIIKSSTPSLNPKEPAGDPEAMVIASAYVPPYPSLSTDESGVGDARKVEVVLRSNRGYTMRDIGVLDQRISRLEYQSALSMLEARAKDVSVTDENGLDRFKNGIFADPLNNHQLADYSNFEYSIAIDAKNGIARPKIETYPVDLEVADTQNTITTGQLLTLPFASEVAFSQLYASKYRNATESVWQWDGEMVLFPGYDHYKDTKVTPAVNVTIDNTEAWDQFANSPFALNYGDWRTVATSSTSSTAIASSTSSGAERSSSTTTTATTTTNTTSKQTQTVSKLQVGSQTSTQNLGQYVTDVTMNPFMRSREVAVIATGLKPNAKFWAYFDEIPVSVHCAPATIDATKYNVNTGTVSVTSGSESSVVERSAAYGTQLTSNASGDLYAIFKIPANTFRVGDRELLIADVDNFETGEDAIQSQCRSIFTASAMTTTENNINLTTIQPVLSTKTTSQTKVTTATTVTQRSNTVTTTVPRTTRPVGGSGGEGAGGGRGEGDPLGQSFLTAVPAGIPGMFMSQIGVFFKAKDPTLGLTLKVCRMVAGVPDSSKLVATSYLKSSQINVSANGSVETIFKFDNLPYLTSGEQYTFFLQPDGNSPEYLVWMAEVGQNDIASGAQIFSNPSIGVAFVSANAVTWTPLQTEDVKFKVYRARFTSLTGTATFTDQDDEYITTTGFNASNTETTIQTGDVVYAQNSTGGLMTSNSSPRGYVQDWDNSTDQLILDSSTGGFAANTVLEIHRPPSSGNTAQLNANTLISTATVKSIDNCQYSIVVPRFGVVTPLNTSIGYTFKGLDETNTYDAAGVVVQSEIEKEYLDKVRVIRSKSNRVGKSDSAQFQVTLKSASNYLTPVIDLRRRNALFIRNIINNDLTDEHTRYGNALTKYLSQIITLKEGQDAEDINVFVTGYRPYGTNITAYIKLMNSEDSDPFESKSWTKMTPVAGSTLYGNMMDPSDVREYQFGIGTAKNDGVPDSAYLNDGVVQYQKGTSSTYVGYKQFQIKLVLTSDSEVKVPRLSDIFGIALQK